MFKPTFKISEGNSKGYIEDDIYDGPYDVLVFWLLNIKIRTEFLYRQKDGMCKHEVYTSKPHIRKGVMCQKTISLAKIQMIYKNLRQKKIKSKKIKKRT